ncbi:hypothetical protein JL720_15901 [Aureococcus anophagefferens]|nr:hypothetical protein JL720_15901 [Aureococcus anophagefferens]
MPTPSPAIGPRPPTTKPPPSEATTATPPPLPRPALVCEKCPVERPFERPVEQSSARRCARCQSTETAATLKCSRCRSAWYCSRSCQRSDWKAHKATCEPGLELEPLADFSRAAPTCAACGGAACGPDERLGPWDRYRECCGAFLCEGCEFGDGSRKRAGPVPAAADACPRCGAAAAATAARPPRGAGAGAGQQDARFVLGMTLLRGSRAGARSHRAAAPRCWSSRRRRRPADGMGRRRELRGRAYRDKLLVPASTKVAPFLRQAAACGHVRALLELAKMYDAGTEVRRDRKEYARLVELASASGFTEAKRCLSKLYIDGDVLERDREKAARLLGLERTAEMWKDGKGPEAPAFLFTSPAPDQAGRDLPKDEYDDAEMDAVFDGD